MRKEDFFEVLGELDDDIVEGAGSTMKENKIKRPVWIRLGAAAACLCLVSVSAAILFQQNLFTTPGGTPDPTAGGDRGIGGTGEGSAGMIYSVAVYPDTEREEDVDSADVASLTEEEALKHTLAEHLPQQLPEGFHYGRGSLYSTIMKDATRYYMLRVEYISGTIPEQQFSEDGGAIAPNPETIGDCFVVCVWNYQPDASINLYSTAEEATLPLFEKNGAAYIRSGDCCVGVFSETAQPADVFDALRTIGP